MTIPGHHHPDSNGKVLGALPGLSAAAAGRFDPPWQLQAEPGGLGLRSRYPVVRFPPGEAERNKQQMGQLALLPANGFQQAAPNLHRSCLWKGTVTSQDARAA